MPKLTVVRDHPNDFGHRYALISLDGELLKRIKFKESFEMEIAAGEHTIEGKNELGKGTSLRFTAREGGAVTVHVGGVPTGCFAAVMWLFPPAPTIFLSLEPWPGKPGAPSSPTSPPPR